MPIRVRRTRRARLSCRTLAVAATAALMAAFAPAAGAQPADAVAAAGVAAAGVRESAPVYSYADAVRESVWVDTGLDADADGRTDRVAVDIVRPREPAAAGRKIPVIMDASPYYACCGRGNEGQRKTYDADGKPVQFPLFYDNYFVPRGYAFVAVDLAGTSRSDGCDDVGGRSDVQSAKAVVDWLNGRARGYTTRTGADRARATTWSTGAVGMIGKSWDGTVANGVAATGVEGLRTIVPIGAISSWYDYFHSQGAPLYDANPTWLSDYVNSPEAKARCGAVQDRIAQATPYTGDWTPAWTERDYVADARKVKASVFVVHGQQDLNVRANQFGQWWDALAANGVERKIWLSQTGHVDPFDFRRADWVRTLHRWFDHHLLGYDNGIDREPMADVERAPDRWTTDRVWPAPGTAPTVLRPTTGGTPGVGGLDRTRAPRGATETFTDDPALSELDWAADIDRGTPAKAGFSTTPLTRDLRLSGSSTVTVTATPTTSSAHLSAVLVDLGPDTIRAYDEAGEGITTLTERSCWGASTPGDSACFKDTRARTADVGHTVVSRGWADLGTWADPRRGRPLTPGRAYTITLKLAPTDHVVPAGHRLALIVAGTDKDLIDPPATRPTVTLDLTRTWARVPLLGGAGAFDRATAGDLARAAGVQPGDAPAGRAAPARTGAPIPGEAR
ncbi:Xaa-Pro dipeptidyl-peptidase [Streptomyces showdoensis]|uniref:X-prolyl-dipeptidyl aminopeptidase n=1 Tax=Streptomyces showdoensis TaxID=68268 RepID=A0A2P2GHI5_STREW|nr:Xaa-Pro dipeptidyl-peptidase [Streptomyces showdoensis]KKZ70982.1 x-prolyl-dipeptidyl aminopeptidase [Streptomyces showdoensis]